jgi:hypothetical protein
VLFGCLVWGVHLIEVHEQLADRQFQQLYSFHKDGLYHNESNSVKTWIIVECISTIYLSNLACFTLCHLLVQILYRAKSLNLNLQRRGPGRGAGVRTARGTCDRRARLAKMVSSPDIV